MKNRGIILYFVRRDAQSVPPLYKYMPLDIPLEEAQQLFDDGGKFAFDVKDPVFNQTVTENLWYFSEAKTEDQLMALRGVLLKDGVPVPFREFLASAQSIFTVYNKQYLAAEFNHVVASSQMASKWKDQVANAKLLPNLRYSTVNDGRVRPAHQVLEGVIRPLQDPFWDSHYPPNGWNCRCSVTQIFAGVISSPLPAADVPPAFQNNIGKTGKVFGDKHPYMAYINSLSDQQREAMLNKLKDQYAR
jgi:SPP1 gp7 family putative phage head morphogenesis protein